MRIESDLQTVRCRNWINDSTAKKNRLVRLILWDSKRLVIAVGIGLTLHGWCFCGSDTPCYVRWGVRVRKQNYGECREWMFRLMWFYAGWIVKLHDSS